MLPAGELAKARRIVGAAGGMPPTAAGQESTGVDMRSITSSARRSTVLDVWAV